MRAAWSTIVCCWPLIFSRSPLIRDDCWMMTCLASLSAWAYDISWFCCAMTASQSFSGPARGTLGDPARALFLCPLLRHVKLGGLDVWSGGRGARGLTGE